MRATLNLIWLLSYLMLILTILSVFSLPVWSISPQDKQILQTETELICQSFNKPCKLTFDTIERVQGYTTRQGTIILTQGLINKLNYNETKAVVLHEIGHHILNHYDRTDEFIDTWNLQKGTLKAFRHKMETEADIFATSYYLYHNTYNYLPDALLKITDKTKEITSQTHPSTITRIQNINKFTKEITQHARL